MSGELNRLEEAYAEFQQATRRFPGYIEALADWGGALASEGLLPDAIFKWEAALRINRRSFYVYKVYKGWGNALFDQEEYALAIAKYQKALEFSPADVAIRKNLERAEEELSKSRPRQVTNHQVDYCRDNDPFTGLRQQRSRACLLSRKDRLELDHG